MNDVAHGLFKSCWICWLFFCICCSVFFVILRYHAIQIAQAIVEAGQTVADAEKRDEDETVEGTGAQEGNEGGRGGDGG